MGICFHLTRPFGCSERFGVDLVNWAVDSDSLVPHFDPFDDDGIDPCEFAQGDFAGDGIVNAADLSVFLLSGI